MKRLYSILVILVLCIMTIAGCTQATTAPATSSPAKTIPVPPPTTAEKPAVPAAATYQIPDKYAPKPEKYGGILKLGALAIPSSFGVPWLVRQGDRVSAIMALEWLIRRGEQPGSLEPRLATSWDLAPDNSSYTFHLRKDVKFHDGTDFNATAVKFNFDKCIETKRPQFKDVKSIDVIDDYTVRVNISNWNSMFILNFGSDSDPALIMSPASYQKNGEQWALTHPIGTGPYKFKDYKDKTYLKWERNENYWEKGVPYLDGMETVAIPDYLTMVASLKSGEIQGAGIDFITAKQLQSDTNYRTWVSFNNLGVALTMNEKDPASIWYNKKMRQALEYAIDKEKICKSLGAGFYEPVYEVIRGIHGAGKPDTVPRKYDPVKAKQLMVEAGFPEGVKTTLNYSSTYGAKDFLVAMQANLADVGIKMDLVPMDAATYNQLGTQPPKGNDMRLETVRGDPLYPLVRVIEDLSENTMYFPGAIRPAGFQQLLTDAMKLKDPAQIIAACEKMEKLAYEDVMILSLWTNPMLSVMSVKVQDADSVYGQVPYAWYMYTWFKK